MKAKSKKFLSQKSKELFFLNYALFSLLPSYFCFSQRNNFQTYSLEQGLPQATVYCIIQDNRGYLWLGTDGGGLCRFDGINFRTFNKKDGFMGQTVRSLMQDSKGRIWAGTKDEGIIIYDGTTFISLGKNQGLAGTTILCMLEDENGTVWTGTDDAGLLKIIPSPSPPLPVREGDKKSVVSSPFKVEVIDQSKGLSNNSVMDIHKDKTGHLWLATFGGGINILTPSKDTFQIDILRGGREIPSDQILSVSETNDETLWFGTLEQGIFSLSPAGEKSNRNFKLNVLSRKITVYNPTTGFLAKTIWKIVSTSENELWFASTEDGLFRYSAQNGFERFTDKEGLPSTQLLCIFEDKEKNIWLGTNGGGLCKFGGDIFSHYTEKDGLPANNVYGIDMDSSGTLWLGTSGGLAQMNLGTGEPVCKNFSAKDGLLGNTVLSVSAKSRMQNQNIWMAVSNTGIAKYDGKKFFNYSETSGLLDNSAYSIYTDKNGIVWIGSKQGISRYDGKRFLSITMEDMKIGSPDVLVIIQDRNENLWFGTGGGLAKYSGEGTITTYDEAEGLFHKEILSLAEDNFGNIWIGTKNGGLYRFDVFTDDKIKIHLVANDSLLSSNSVRSIIFLDEKNKKSEGKEMAVGTDKGFDKITFDDKGNILKVKNYNATDGFTGVECNDNAIYRDARGNIWFGTVKGLTRFDPSSEIQNPNPPLIHITGIKLFFKEADWQSRGDSVLPWFNLPNSLELSYSENHLTFHYAAISLGNPQKIKYRYMLEGADEEWSPDRKETSVTFSGLSPGTYTFKVMAQGANGVWNTEPAAFSFTINPPWYRTTAAYIIYIILLAGGIYFYVKYRERALLLEKKVLEEKVQERTAEVVRQKDEIEGQKKLIEEKNKDITDSINYAQRIQQALLPSEEGIKKAFPESFIFFRPRDIVSGDFYWFAKAPPQPSPLGREQEVPDYFTVEPSLYALLKERAEQLRNQPTEAEKIAWELLKGNNTDFHVRRQHIIGRFIVDFVNIKTKTVIEIDGDIHDYQKEEDEERKKFLNKHGFEVIRFRNEKVIGNPDGFCNEVKSILISREQKVLPNGEDLGGALFFLAAADCTGHGVPGAFMSMICTALLNEAVNEKGILHPNEILNEVRKGIIQSLKQTGAMGEQKDGMDVALVSIKFQVPRTNPDSHRDQENNKHLGLGTCTLEYAGANNSLYLIKQSAHPVLEEIDPDNMPVAISDRTDEFKNNTLELKKGDVFYLFTDGYADQFGGPKGKKFKYAQFKQLLLSVRNKPIDEQKLLIEKSLDEWKGAQDQVDDILVIGVRI